MYFQTAINCDVFICKSYAHLHMYICRKRVRFSMYFLHLLHLSVALFLCQLVPPCEVSEDICCISLPLLVLLFICLPLLF